MNTPIKLSVSSILLAGVLAGCSQQQINPYSAGHYAIGSSKVSSSHQKMMAKPKFPQRVIQKKTHYKKQYQDTTLPPSKKSGQCYVKIKQPAVYKTLSKKVLTQKAMTKRVFVRPPQYRWIVKKVLVKPVSYTRRVIPARYKTITQRVMVKPSYHTWKKGHGAITRIDQKTGAVLCRVKIPAVYKNVKKKVLVHPARTIKTTKPALYKQVKTKKLLSPAQYKTVYIPARYTTKKYRVKTASAKYIWRPVSLCKDNKAKHSNKIYSKKSPHSPKKGKQIKSNRYQAMKTKPHRYKPHEYRKVSKTQKTKTYKTVKSKPKRYAVKQYRKVSYSRNITPSSTIKKANYAVKTSVYPSPRKATKRYRPRTNKVVKTYKPAIRANTRKVTKTYKPAIRANTRKVIKTYKPAIKANAGRVVRHTKKLNKSKVQLTRANAVFHIQTALTKKGFNLGKIDGKLGSATVAALTAFQKKNGLQAGKLNRATLRALELI